MEILSTLRVPPKHLRKVVTPLLQFRVSRLYDIYRYAVYHSYAFFKLVCGLEMNLNQINLELFNN